MSSIPVLFVSHGAPISLEDALWMDALGQWGKTLGEIREILVLSAHWVTGGLVAAPAIPVPLLYDFSGFPDRLYRLNTLRRSLPVSLGGLLLSQAWR